MIWKKKEDSSIEYIDSRVYRIDCREWYRKLGPVSYGQIINAYTYDCLVIPLWDFYCEDIKQLFFYSFESYEDEIWLVKGENKYE